MALKTRFLICTFVGLLPLLTQATGFDTADVPSIAPVWSGALNPPPSIDFDDRWSVANQTRPDGGACLDAAKELRRKIQVKLVKDHRTEIDAAAALIRNVRADLSKEMDKARGSAPAQSKSAPGSAKSSHPSELVKLADQFARLQVYLHPLLDRLDPSPEKVEEPTPAVPASVAAFDKVVRNLRLTNVYGNNDPGFAPRAYDPSVVTKERWTAKVYEAADCPKNPQWCKAENHSVRRQQKIRLINKGQALQVRYNFSAELSARDIEGLIDQPPYSEGFCAAQLKSLAKTLAAAYPLEIRMSSPLNEDKLKYYALLADYDHFDKYRISNPLDHYIAVHPPSSDPGNTAPESEIAFSYPQNVPAPLTQR